MASILYRTPISTEEIPLNLDTNFEPLEAEWDSEALTPVKKALFPSFWSGEHDTFHDFLSAMDKYPLLKERELPTARLARQYVDFCAALEAAQTKLQQDGVTKPTQADILATAGYSPAETQHLQIQGRHAAQRMVECNLRLVVTVAKKYNHSAMSIEQD